MKFDVSNPNNKFERNLLVLIKRYQLSQSKYKKSHAIKYAKENWESISDDFKKACYWVFGRETFVSIARFKATDECIRAEDKVLDEQEERFQYDV